MALIPAAARELVRAGHEVYVQSGADLGSGYADARFTDVGVKIASDAADLYARAEMVIKVKEPIDAEYELLNENHLLFCFLHLAAVPELARVLCEKRVNAVAFETVQVRGPVAYPGADERDCRAAGHTDRNHFASAAQRRSRIDARGPSLCRTRPCCRSGRWKRGSRCRIGGRRAGSPGHCSVSRA